MKKSSQNNVKRSAVGLDDANKHTVKKLITSDYVLELWERSKTAKGQQKIDLVKAAKVLSQNIGGFIVD